MLFLLFISGFSLTVIQCEAYVLLQVRKQDANHSNVDALIHKVVSSDMFDKFAAKMGQKTLQVRAQNSHPVNRAIESEEEAANSAGLAIPAPEQDNEPTLSDLITMVGRKFARGPSGPMFRSKSDGYLFKPETVHLRSGQSSVYSVRPDTVIVALRELLSSLTLRKYLDKLSRKAAVVYRTVENDLQPIAANLLHYKT